MSTGQKNRLFHANTTLQIVTTQTPNIVNFYKGKVIKTYYLNLFQDFYMKISQKKNGEIFGVKDIKYCHKMTFILHGIFQS